MNNEKLTFEVDKFEILEYVNHSQLAKIRMWIVSEGDNLHKFPIKWEAIQLSKESLVCKPVLCKCKNGKFQGHEEDQIPVGTTISIDDIYEEEIDGVRWLVADAFLWVKYFPEIIEVIKNNDNETAISMEILVLETQINEDEIEEITLFSFTGVTLIGVTPAIVNAHATMIQFSELVAETKNLLFSSENEDLNKTLENPEKEDDTMPKDFTSEKFGLTSSQTRDILYNALSEYKYTNGDYSWNKYWIMDYDEEFVYVCDEEENLDKRMKYVIADNVATVDVESAEQVIRAGWMPVGEETIEEKFAKLEEEKQALETEKETFSKENTELNEKFTALELEFSQFKETVVTEKEALENENTELKTFKANIEEQERVSKIEFAINSVSDDLTIEQVDEWREKAKEFASVDEFTNAIKAFAFDVAIANKDPEKVKFSRVHIPKQTEDKPESKSVWDRI